MPGSKYTLELEVKIEKATAQIGKMEKEIGKLNEQVEELTKGNKEAEKSLKSLDWKKMGEGVMQMANQVSNLSQKFLGFSSSVTASSADMVSSIVQDASIFEDAESTMRFAFDKNWENMFERVKKEAADLTFTFAETLDLAASMGRLGIDPFGAAATIENTEVFRSKTGEMISAFQVLQDTADGANKTTREVSLAIKNALGGQFKVMKNLADVLPETFKKWVDGAKELTTEQERYDHWLTKLAGHFGGAGALKAKNFSKILAQIPDLIQIIRAGVGKKGLKLITEALSELVDSLAEFSKNKEAMAALSQAFSMVAGAIAFVVRAGARLVDFLGRLLAANTWLPALGVAAIAAAIAISFLIGVTLALGAALATVVALVMMVGIKVIALFVLLLPVFAGLGVAIAAVVGIFVAFVAAFVSAMGSIDASSGILTKITLLWQAFTDIVSSFNGESAVLREGLEGKLKKAGMFEYAEGMVQLLKNIMAFWKGLKQGWAELTEAVSPHMHEMLVAIKEAIFAIAEAFGFTDAATSGTQDWSNAAMTLVSILAQIIIVIAKIITVAANFVATLAEWGVLSAIVYGLIVLLGLLAVVFVILAVMTIIAFLPVILVFAALAIALYVIYSGIMAIGEMFGLVDSKAEKAASSTDKLTASLERMAKTKGADKAATLVEGMTPEAVRAGVPAGVPTVTPAMPATMPTLPGMPPGAAGGMPQIGGMAAQYMKPGQGLAAPSHVLPPTVQGAVSQIGGDTNEKVVTAVNALKTPITNLGKSIKGQKINITLNVDGQAVAKAIKSLDDGANGENN